MTYISDPMVKKAVEELGSAFHEFKQTHEEQLKALEKKNADPLMEEKMERLSDALDKASERIQKLSTLNQRPSLLPSAPHDTHRDAFLQYLCKGEEHNLKPLETKRYNEKVKEEGGFFLPEALELHIYNALLEQSPMRSVASKIETSRHQYEVLMPRTPHEMIWGNEIKEGVRAKGGHSVSFDKKTFPLFQMMALTRLSSTLLEDSQFRIEFWFLDEIGKTMIAEEKRVFAHGDGKEMPLGLMLVPTSKDVEFDKIQALSTGLDNVFPKENPDEIIMDLMNLLPSEYLNGSVFMGSKEIISMVRRMKDQNGQYLLLPNLTGKPGSTFFGYPVVQYDSLQVNDKTKSLFFGNFKEGWTIVDRPGISTMRDPYSAKPDIDLLVRKRIGGGLNNANALKVLHLKK